MALTNLHETILKDLVNRLSNVDRTVLSMVNHEFKQLCGHNNNPPIDAKIRHVLEWFYRTKPAKCNVRIVFVSGGIHAHKEFIIQNWSNKISISLGFGNVTNPADCLKLYTTTLTCFLSNQLTEIIIWVTGVSDHHHSIVRLASKLYSACARQCPVYHFKPESTW